MAFTHYAVLIDNLDTDVLFFQTFGTKWIVLNSLKASSELLDQRGSNYADRPRFVMFEEMGWSPTLTWLRWGPKCHLHRKVLQPPFAKSKVKQYQAHQRREALILAKGVVDNPEDWMNCVRRFSVAVVLKITYGLDVDSHTSPWIKLGEDSAEAVGKSGAPASSLMDRFPATRYLPSWLPFMERLRFAHTWRPAIQKITELPFQAALELPASVPSFVRSRMRARTAESPFTLSDIKGAAATILIAGNDTTSSTLNLLVLYLLQNPGAQRRAQAEVDSVTAGGTRLPDFADLQRLPYLNLILNETYRICPLSPLGIPHASIKDDVYQGRFIPAGTIVYPNVWAMNRDEKVYRKPELFWPERFESRDKGGWGEPLPVGNFGFGRRICIGRNLAENSLLIALAILLATTEIGWPIGEDGEEERFEAEFCFRGQAIVLPFRASFISRSEKLRDLLEQEIGGCQ
ncbi:cytochrome P450 1A2 [Cladorrhinum samala]|uniref:Cytochrome P450 1A2 n=1 Tax=Cladorrhinum samala TaxID=585594 RepID=A0AAV9HVM8_9PEZI|nr:cytochrome P450 1A2 [Cladorrhinum samala]